MRSKTFINRKLSIGLGITVLAAIALLFVGSRVTFAQQSRPRTFASATRASQALFEAVKSKDEPTLRAILGAGPELISSTDETEEKLNRERFVEKYQEMHRLVNEPDGTTILYIGAENWPFPFPLISKHDKWSFDSDAGSQEILAREIGRNEITAVQVCQAVEDVSAAGTQRNPAQDPIREFAASLGSGTNAGSAARAPFRGYYFRSVSGKTGDVVLVAYPAQYRSSGVMSFIMTGSGLIYEKDLGSETPTAAQQLQGTPGVDWVPVDESASQ